MISIKRILLGNDHDDAKWLVLEGSIDGCPQVTKRRTINTAALVSGDLTIAGEKAALISDVEEYHARYLSVQAAISQL